MINDANTLSEIRKDWNGVELLRDKLQRSAFAAASGIGGTFPFVLANAAHNLPFFHAYGVLNDVLEQLAKERHFTCKSTKLGALMNNSKNALPWHDFNLVDEGRDFRNKVAHEGDLLNRGDCWKYVDAVKAELCGWKVL